MENFRTRLCAPGGHSILPCAVKNRFILPLLCSALLVNCSAEEVLFRDDFKTKLGEGWSWLREHREAWRVGERGLEVRIEPGNMWGPQNDAKNVLLRRAPELQGEIEVTATVENHPTAQYEQADLVWYYSDSTMVKLGLELVDGQLSIVMGREENDRAQTVKIILIKETTVQLMFLVKGKRIYGRFRAPTASDWQEVGDCDLPSPAQAEAKISLQFYQGAVNVEHWARVSQFSAGLAGESKVTNAWQQIAAWRDPMPKVKVLSGTELEIGGVRCALFGVRIQQSSSSSARDFLEAYMKACGKYFSIYNSDAPISRSDGVPLVWLQIHGNSGWAQEALVRLGLAEVDFKGFEDYKFQVPAKSGREEFDWKKCLSDAKAFHDAGKKPFLDFAWPVTK